ncbi:uncharacterized protein [Rutidosis leptorrhynchoides]|uniref:uncharacterized protein n=1 Tax=Rutidosis leptorrhynchoides TaxID=125765 RepID=UPI003A98D4B5
MEMNNLRVESHVAQSSRRHKLRFQQNSGDPNHHHPQPDHHHFEPTDIHRSFQYNPNIFPSEMLNSVASRNPQLLLPSTHGLVSLDQDSCQSSGSGSGNLGYSQPERMLISSNSGGSYTTNLSYQQDCNNWKTVVTSQQEKIASDHWNNNNNNVVSYGYHQDMHNVPAFNSSQYYQNTLQQDHQATLAQHPQSKNDSGMNQSIPCWMNDNHEGNFNTTQGLSLSLSSVPQLKDAQPMLESGQKTIKSDHLHDLDLKCMMGVSAFAHRNTGPLGPFTGYATILKNSKYMKSAQELLNESCDVGFQESVQSCHDVYSHKILEDEISWASDSSVANSYGEHGPDFNRKKASLLYLQEEICRKYKQYLQQMQMVISSFETVAGLSAATPYVCLALKVVSRHFHYVKNVISDQLSQMKKAMGEGLCYAATNSNKLIDANTSPSRLKSTDHIFGKSSGGTAGLFAPQQSVWRPQRGLPERAISVLKTWLFDHFLHPYPSDADKHMLSTQTGLTRNQVSNWFINARVRIWKPMVEEIHTLETKGMAEPNPNNPQLEGDQGPTRMDTACSLSNTQPPQCSRNTGVRLTVNQPSDHVGDYEQLGRPEYQIPLSNMDRLMSIVPYPASTFDASGLGPVSLTLGLRQNAEHVQQLRQHFGGQLIHDFVG